MTRAAMKTTIAALLLAAGPASAFCPDPPAVLKPQPGEVYGCPVFARTTPGKFWFSDFVVPFDNNLYGFYVDVQLDNRGKVTAGGFDLDGKPPMRGRSNQANQITAIAAQNWTMTQLGNAWGIDFALTPVTFTPTGTSFPSPDGPVIIIAGGIRQGW